MHDRLAVFEEKSSEDRYPLQGILQLASLLSPLALPGLTLPHQGAPMNPQRELVPESNDLLQTQPLDIAEIRALLAE